MQCGLSALLLVAMLAGALSGSYGAISGTATYYTFWDSSLGSCGYALNTIPQNLVAMPPSYMKASCGKCLKVTNSATGKSINVLITDTCADCAETHIDLSNVAFKQLADLNAGVINVSFEMVDSASCSGSGSNTTSSTSGSETTRSSSSTSSGTGSSSTESSGSPTTTAGKTWQSSGATTIVNGPSTSSGRSKRTAKKTPASDASQMQPESLATSTGAATVTTVTTSTSVVTRTTTTTSGTCSNAAPKATGSVPIMFPYYPLPYYPPPHGQCCESCQSDCDEAEEDDGRR